ncbi:MAG: hypothetical protein ACI9TF_001164, partial [Paracrocinitomix sp.]
SERWNHHRPLLPFNQRQLVTALRGSQALWGGAACVGTQIILTQPCRKPSPLRGCISFTVALPLMEKPPPSINATWVSNRH